MAGVAMLTHIQNIYAEKGLRVVLTRGAMRGARSLLAPFASLHTIGEWCGTDKVHPFPVCPELSYLKVYDSYFRQLRLKPVHLLEIGALYGNSLAMWRAYFPKGRIFGLDIDPSCARHEARRISMTIGSQSDPVVLAEAVRKAEGHFDIVIDDGSHVNQHMMASFRYLYPHLRPGGFYVLEDLASSYSPLDDEGIRERWPGMAYNAPTDDLNNRRGELDAFFNELVHELDHDRGQAFVHFWPYCCVIRKAP